MTTKKTTKKTVRKKTGKATSAKASTTHVKEVGSKEDRSGQRVPIQLLVDYRSDGHYLFDFCRDLGTGGVFIQTEKPLTLGSSIDLTFTIPDSKETLSTKGTVIWVQSVEGSENPGMGVQFSGFSGEQRKLLERFVVRYHGQKLGPQIADDSKQRVS